MTYLRGLRCPQKEHNGRIWERRGGGGRKLTRRTRFGGGIKKEKRED